MKIIQILLNALLLYSCEAFTVPTKNYRYLSSTHGHPRTISSSPFARCMTSNPKRYEDDTNFNLHPSQSLLHRSSSHPCFNSDDKNDVSINDHPKPLFLTAATFLTTTTPLLLLTPSSTAVAKATSSVPFNTGDFNPETFRPVCPTSDSLYRILQSSTQSLVGPDNYVEYGPLIAGGLLRVRLELCVVESFFQEAVGPFIEKEGLSWILPLHETVETFLAGTIFALASTFILVGSTKIVSVLVTYIDVFIGGPCRLLGGFFFDRSKGKPVTLDIGFGPFKTRVVGPGSPKEDAKRKEEVNALEDFLDVSGVESKNLPIVITSGVVKVAGETLKVSFRVY